jgi:uncharacterized protein (DUF362 family)
MRDGITRRDFVRCALAVGAGAIVPVVGVRKMLAEESPLGPEVICAKGERIEAVKAAIKALGGIEAFVKPDYRVVIKPNISFDNPPEMATTTHPEVVKTIAQLCLDAGAKRVLVLDHTIREPNLCKKRSGIEAALKDMPRVSLLTINQASFFEEVAVPGGVQVRTVQIAKEALRADALIAVPVAKSHSASVISMSVKGMMGLIWDRGAFHGKYHLHQAIADLSTVLKADLTVIDASRALLTRGPGGPGRVAELKCIVASRDPVAADAYTVGLASWYNQKLNGTQVGHLALASKQGAGEVEVSKMRIRQIGI